MKPNLLCALALLATCAGCSWGRPLNELAPDINKTLANAAVKISPRDELTLQFSKQQEWNQNQINVDLEGNASFLGLGKPIQVAGMTIAELISLLEDRYGSVVKFNNPKISVTVRTFAARTINVSGQVRRPGPIDIGPGRLTLIEALGTANPMEYAELDNVLLIRWDGAQQLSWRIDCDDAFYDAPTPLYLQPHDVIYVPMTGIGYVNRWIDQYIRRLIPFPLPSPIGA